jgi:hypothetical protein
MPPPTLDEVDLGEEKRRIEFQPIVPLWGYFVIAALWMVMICGGGILILFGAAGDGLTLAILLLVVGGLIMLSEVLLIGVMWFFRGEKLLVFKDGVCYERAGNQECYRWKEITKIVWYSADPRVYWLYFKSGRKVCLSLIGGVPEEDWSAFRRMLEKKMPDKFVDES